MKRVTTVELHKEKMKFSAGHFTIFSATDREAMHGHNYSVYAALTTEIRENGLSFDYRYYKDKLYQLCRQLNRTFLLPLNSPYLTLNQEDDYLYGIFNGEKIPFLKKDVTLLPLSNITVEELSQWFVHKLLEDQTQLQKHRIFKILIKVFSGPGQSASACWQEKYGE